MARDSRLQCPVAAMTLVNNNQIKKVRRKLLEDVFFFFHAGQPLVKSEVNFVRFINCAVLNFGHLVAKMPEVVHNRLVG